MKTVMFMKKLDIRIKRITELLPLHRSTAYRKLRAERQKIRNKRKIGKGLKEGVKVMIVESKAKVISLTAYGRIDEIALKYPFYDYRRT